MVGRSKTKTFEGIVNRVRKKLDGWKQRFLSQARKEILLKAVVQAIPTYCMSVFQLPKTLCKKMESMMNKFLWQRKESLGGLNWMSWSRLGFSKKNGGLGF
jgi:hypothetical protein